MTYCECANCHGDFHAPYGPPEDRLCPACRAKAYGWADLHADGMPTPREFAGLEPIVRSMGWEPEDDLVNLPPHYTGHPSGVECIQITEHMNFCRGNAVKYIWRCGEKGDPVQDLKKARWYIDREIERLEKAVDNSS